MSVDAMELIIIAILAVIVILLLLKHNTKGNKEQESVELINKLQHLQQTHFDLMQSGYDRQRREMHDDFERRLARAEADNQTRLSEMKHEFERETERLRQAQREQLEVLRREAANEYKALSQEVLESNASALKQQNLEQIDSILNPLKERIGEFNKIVIDSYAKENASRQSLSDQITNLIELNKTIGEEAKNLTSALKSESKIQGDWGESVLKTLLEQSGLEEGIHFEMQVTRDENGNILRDEEGNGLRPDVIVHLPDRKNIIIDSKVSLTAFTAYHETENTDEKRALAKKHLASVKKHIKELSDKGYQKDIKNSAEHVLMFVPIENAYLMAMQSDPQLWKYAYDLHVAIVSPTHLFSVMQIISQLWNQDSRNRNALKIAESGGKIYDKLTGFCEEFVKIRKALDIAATSYENALKRLSTGRGNVIGMAENIRILGVRVKKSLPEEILRNAELPEDSSSTTESPKELGSLEEEAE